MQNANFRLKRDNMSSFNLLSVTQSLFRDCGIFLACFSYILFLTKRPLYSVFYKAATIVLNIISNLPMVFLLRARDISSEYLNKTTTIILSGFCWKNGFKNLFFFPGTQMAGAFVNACHLLCHIDFSKRLGCPRSHWCSVCNCCA